MKKKNLFVYFPRLVKTKCAIDRDNYGWRLGTAFLTRRSRNSRRGTIFLVFYTSAPAALLLLIIPSTS